MSDLTRDDVWETMEDEHICMLVSWDGNFQRARPMAAMPRPEENAVYFLTSAESGKDEQIEMFPRVALTFTSKGGNDYAAIYGHAVVSNHREKIRELFSPMAKAWWDSADDPDIRLITVTPEEAELWDGPNRAVAMVKMALAAATDKAPDIGENARFKM